jgi:SAM-dependent methyltransferase
MSGRIYSNMSKIDFQDLASKVPMFYHFPIYQSVWIGGKEIIKGGRDDMGKRMSLIRKEDIKDKIVVDIGCNLGAASFWAIENGAKSCYGFDVVPEAIDLANKIAEHYNLECYFGVKGFNEPQEKYGSVAFCFACHDDIRNDKVLLENLKKYEVVYFETHLKHTFQNWDLPQIIKDNFNLEYLGETGEGVLRRDLYRLS